MKKLSKKILISSLALSTLFSVQAAEITVGTIAGPETEVMEAAVKVAKDKFGLDVKIVEFNDYVTPNVALADGQLDANAFQHQPYLDRMINDRGFELVAVGNTFVYPIGGYSEKYKNIADLPEGATIAVPNDPSNEGRTLLLLEKHGLIKLKDSSNLEASILDIAENPKNFQFKEIEAPQLPRVLPEVDLAFINSSFAVPAGLLPSEHSIIVEDKESPYVNLIAVRKGDESKEEIKQLVEAYQSPEVEAKALELFKGGAVPGWK